MGEKLTNTAEIIEHKGVQILFDNLTGLKRQELVNALKAVSKAMTSKTPNKKDWVAVNVFTGCVLTEPVIKILIRIRSAMMPFFLAIADVGLNPTQKYSIELIHELAKSKVPLKYFDTVEEAKEWVVSVYMEQKDKKP